MGGIEYLGTYVDLTWRRAMRADRLTVKQKQTIFRELVDLQDLRQMTIEDSLRRISEEYGITEVQLRKIQDEGIDAEWPPLVPEKVR
jgi:hypothetical protein